MKYYVNNVKLSITKEIVLLMKKTALKVVDAMLRSTLQRSINYYINTADDEPEYQPLIMTSSIFLDKEGDITEDDIKGRC